MTDRSLKVYIGLIIFLSSGLFFLNAHAKEEYNPSLLNRDPFNSLIPRIEEEGEGSADAKVTLPDFVVQGLIWGASFNQAIIDDTVLRTGDIIKEAKVLKIEKEGVTFLYKGKIFILPPGGATPGGATKLDKEDKGGN